MQNKNYSTRSITEAGLICALILVIMILSAYIPPFALLGNLALPVLITVLYIRHDLRIAISAVFISGVLTAIFLNPINALVVVVLSGLMGVTLGYCVKKEKNYLTTMVSLSIASIISNIISMVITLKFIYHSTLAKLLQQNITMLQDVMDKEVQIINQMGLPKENIEATVQLIKSINVEMLMLLIPASFIALGIFMAFVNYMITKGVFKRLGYNMVQDIPFTEIYLNNIVSLLLILGYFVGVYLSNKNLLIGKYIFATSMLLMQLAFTFIGLFVLLYFLKNKFKLSKPLMALIIILTVFNPLLARIYMFIGLADMVFDFRRVNPNRMFIRKKMGDK